MKRLYKKTLKAFGGAALYLDKVILKELGISTGDEIIIELNDGKAILSKPTLDANKIKDLLDANAKSKERN